MGNKLSSNDKHHIKKAFDYIDADHDGLLTVEELKTSLKISEEDAKNIISTVDRNNDGVINFDEFLRVVEKRFLDAFHNIDRKDNLGLFTKEELKKAYKKAGVSISERQIDEYFATLDENNDNMISLQEFIIAALPLVKFDK